MAQLDFKDPFAASTPKTTLDFADPFAGGVAAKPAAPVPEAPKPKLTRSWGEVATDTLTGVAKGAVDMAKSAHQITSLANPANLARGAVSKLSRATLGRDVVPTESEALSTVASTASRLAGGGDVEVQSRAGMLDTATKALERQQSPILQRKKQELADTEGFFASAKKVVTDPVLLGNFAAEQVPNLVGMGYGTAASGAGAAARAGAPVLQRALAGGATREAAQALAGKAGAEAGKQAAERFVLGSNTLFEAGSAADQAYQDVLSQPDEVWQANPEFQRELAAGTPAERIKERMAQEAGARAAGITAPIAALAGRLVAPFEADVFAGRLARTPGAMASGAAREAGEEAIQEGGSQFAGNLAIQPVDPNRGLLEGVPEAAGTGAALGGVMGAGLAVGGAGANTEGRARRAAEPPPLPEPQLRRPMLALPPPTVTVDSQGQATTPGQADAQMRQDAAGVEARAALGLTPDVNRARAEHPGAAPNASTLTRPEVPFPDAAPGSMSEVANLLSAAAPAVAPAVAPQEQQSASAPVRDGRGGAPSAADAAPFGYVPPWVDASTGEVREPNLDEVKAAIHQSWDFMSQNGTGVYRPAVRRALGLKFSQFDQAWNQVVRERKEGLTAPAPPAGVEDADAQAHAWQNEQFDQATDEQVVAMTRDFFGDQIGRVTPDRAAEILNRPPERIRALWPQIQQGPSSEATNQPEGGIGSEAAAQGLRGSDPTAVPAPGRTVDQPDLPAQEEPASDDAAAGVRAPEAVEEAPAAAAPKGPAAPVYDESSDVLDTDITPPSGGPFTQRGAADAQARRHEGGRVFEVEGGFVVRKPRPSTEEGNGTSQSAEEVPVGSVVVSPHAQPVSEPEGQVLSDVRGQGNPGLSAMDGAGRVRQVSPGSGPASNGGADTGPDRSGGELRAGELSMGNSSAAGGEPAILPSGMRGGPADDRAGSGAAVESSPRDSAVSAVEGAPDGAGAVPAAAPGPEGFEVGDVSRGNPDGPPVGSEAGRAPADAAGAAGARNSTGARAARGASKDSLRDAANQAATSPLNDLAPPTEGQIKAGNYAKGHIRINGHDISIENPAGSKRRPEWPALKNHYGYFKGTIGKDKDHVDVFMTDRAHDPKLPVFVVDQVNQDGTFDEHKVIMGSPSEAAARRAYLSNYSRGWTGLGAITQFTQDDFKAWLGDDKKTKRPAGKLAKPAAANESVAPAVKADKPTEPSGGQLFSRGDDHRGIDFDRALQLKRELTAKWGDRAPNVVMIQNAEGFPDSAKVDPEYRRGEGFFDGRDTVWLNVERIPTEERLRQVLAHEALGHYGVEQVVGQAQWDGIVQTIASLETSGKASAQTQAVFADVRRRYGDVDPTTFAKEAIAVMAERGVRNTFVDRVVAAVRRFLRNLMPSLSWSEADLRGLLSAADSFLRAGRDQATRQATVQAYAFSRPDAEGTVAGDGQRSIKMGGETFVERSGTFYLVNGTGHPKDFTVFSQALDTATATGGEVRLDDAMEGQRPTYSVVVPEVVARGAFQARGNFSLPPPAGPTFAEQVRARLEANNPRGPALQVGRTPAVLRMLGMPDLPLTMPTSVLFKIATGKGGARAPLTERQIVKLPELLDDPLAITDSNTEEAALVIVTRAKDAKGNPILVSVAAERSAQGNPALKVNIVTSAYGKENAGWLDRERAAGRLRYAENELAPDRQVSSDAALNLRVEPDGQRPQNPEAAQSGQAQDQAEAQREGSKRKVLSAADLRNFRAAQRAQAFSGGPGLFSKAPDEILADVEAVGAAERDRTPLQKAKDWLADATPAKIKDATRGSWLGLLTTRHLTELGSDYFSNIKHYSDFLAEMQADRNALQSEGEAPAEAARKWASKNREAARNLFGLMHEATLDGVDPAEAYQPLQFKFGGELHEATPKKVKEAVKAVRQQMRERSAENKVDLMKEVELLKSLPDRERARKAKFPGLVDRWNQLPPEAQEHYRTFRDLYKKRSDQVEQAMIDRINEAEGTEHGKRNATNILRQQFEQQRLSGVYFPLKRFGPFFLAAEKDGHDVFEMVESLNALERIERDYKARGWTIVARGKKDTALAKDAPSGTFVADVIAELKKAHVSEATQDQVYQLYLQSMPEMSMRKHQIHRKGVLGWDPDAVRAFAFNMQHGAHQLARMRYSHKLQAVLDALGEQQKAAERDQGGKTREIVAGSLILEELKRRHEWIMNPTDSQLTNLITSAGFVYYLGATPAAALVNLTQTALVSYPFLAARYGGVKAMNALLAASRDAVRTVGNIQRTLKDPEEQAAHKALMASGALDKTQAHNLAGIAEGGLQGYNPAWATAMKWIGMGFHKTEVVNREATGLAAFRLARASGETFNEAVKSAHDAIFDTHFDYSNANRARFMQAGWQKVLLMFRQYSLNMTWMLGRSVWLATRGESPEVKRIARRQLAGIMGMSAVFSGALGLPMAGVVSGVLNALQATFGDDDEPWDAETEFSAFLADKLGPTAAQLVLRGAVNQVTGADIAGRVGLSEMWIRDADRELEGRGLYYHMLEQLAGPMGGVLKNFMVGKNMVDQGHVWRGVETMLPKALKDIMKGIRYAAEGVNTLRGDALLEDKSLSDVLLQAGGFSPARVAERYDRNRALTNYEDHIMRRRQHLMDAFAMSLRLGDEEARAAALGKIQGFNRANPEVAITTASIRRSIASRARYSAKAEGGIVLNPKLAARLKATVGE